MTARLPLLMISMLFSLPAFAARPCVYSGRIELDQASPLYCDGKIVFAPGTVIVTHGNDLLISTSKTITWGTADNGVKIICEDAGATEQPGRCGSVQVSAFSFDGAWSIDPKAPGRKTGEIDVEYSQKSSTYQAEYLGDPELTRVVQNGGVLALR